MIRRLVGAIMVAVLVTGIAIAPANAEPTDDGMYKCMNNMHVWDKRQCPENRQGPFGFPGSGGGPDNGRGILGRILGGLTGGLL